MTTQRADDLELALRLADAADAVAKARFQAADLSVNRKADATHVTDADIAVEAEIRHLLEAERSGDAFYGEESGSTGTAVRKWIIDPIDGTANFLRGVPAWGTLIALSIDGQIDLGVVSSPALGYRWWAARGSGAWLRHGDAAPRQMHVSGVDRLEEASLSFQSLAQWRGAGALEKLHRLSEQVWRDRAYGDVWPYMLLAEGRVDIVAEFDVKPYDLAAIVPIVEEAGGRFSSVDGKPGPWHGSALATNGLLHESVLAELA